MNDTMRIRLLRWLSRAEGRFAILRERLRDRPLDRDLLIALRELILAIAKVRQCLSGHQAPA